MPELPEVETFRRFADRYALNQTVKTVEVFTPKILENTSESELKHAVETHRLSETRRVGKHLLIAIQSTHKKQKITGWLFLHFGMTGYLSYTKNGQSIVNAYGDPTRPEAHVRVRFTFEDGGQFNFHEQRMFGKLGLTPDADAYFHARKLGPDALSVKKKPFIDALKKRKGQLKPALMDQALIAGVGNVYADELLYQCGLNPERKITDLTPKDFDCVYTQMIDVLQRTVDVDSDRDKLPPHYLLHVRKPKSPCPKGHTPLIIKQIGGRTTYFCPVCQPA